MLGACTPFKWYRWQWRFAPALLLALAVALAAWPAGLGSAQQSGPPYAAKQLIFIADGMRPDMVERYARSGDMPNYARVLNQGVTGENGMVSQFPPNTGSGWSSISTGAWAGTHGAVNNTFHIVSNAVTTSTSGFDASLVQAETYQEVVEKAGKKVAVMEWPGALPTTRVKGPVIDFRNFYSSRGVVSNFAIPGVRPDPSLVYTSGLQIRDATDWVGAPPSFSPAKETSFSFRTNPINNTVVTMTWQIYIFDTTNDGQANYDKVFITKEIKDAAQAVADLRPGEWKDIKTSLPQNRLLVGLYMKLIDLTPDLSRFRLYFTSLSRVRANLPDLEQKIALDFPTVVAADFAPLQAGMVDDVTYVEQGLKWYDSFRRIHDYVIQTYNPDVVMAGYPVTDEFSHQFMALSMPSYTGPRPSYGTPERAEAHIKSAYRQADQILGHLWELLGPNTITFVGSDHGFAPTWKSVNVNQVLQDAGLFDPANRGASRAIGYVAGGTANIYVNLKDREQRGVVEQNDYEAVRNQIVNAFNNLSEAGTKVAAAVWRKEETRAIKTSPSSGGYIINAWHPTRTGDVVVVLPPPYQFDAPTTSRQIADAPFWGQHGFLPDAVDMSRNINMHAMFGILGPGVAQGKKIATPRAIDIEPTAAYAMNIPVPRHAEGRVLTEAFADGSERLVPLQVLAWGDYHGQLDPVQARVDNVNVPSGGVAVIGAYWNEAKAEDPDGTIILSDGDNVGGTPPNSAFLNDRPAIEAMNLLGFTASALGNHEFVKGVSGLEQLLSIAKFPYLANNIVDARTGQIPSFTRPYMTVKVNGIDVGIIGVGNPLTPGAVNPRGIQGYNWLDPLEPTNRYVRELVGRGIRTIIVVYHQGSDRGDFDNPTGIFADFARAVDREVDLIVGGHTRVETMARINGILVSEANHAMSTTDMTLLVDPQTRNVSWSWGAFRRPYGGAITPEPTLEALVKSANDQVRPILGEDVGRAASLVDRSRGAESKMGNLVTDAMRATYQVDAVLQNSGGLRADFQPGAITKGDVFAVLPFGNAVVTGKLKGSDLLAALENGVSDLSGTAGRFIQLSGVRFAYDPAAPSGRRVLWAVLSDGKQVDPNANYTVATNDFLAVGGDNYTMLTRLTDTVSREQLWEVAANYVKSLGTVDPKVEGRIIPAQAGQPSPTPPTAATPALPTPVSILPTAAPPTPTTAAAPSPVVEPTVILVTPVPVDTPAPFPGMPRSGAGGPTWLPLFAAVLMLIGGLLLLRRRAVR